MLAGRVGVRGKGEEGSREREERERGKGSFKARTKQCTYSIRVENQLFCVLLFGTILGSTVTTGSQSKASYQMLLLFV